MKRLLLLLLLPAACLGQGDQTIIRVPVDNAGNSENAILHLPDDYGSTTTNYPIIVFLHGVGEGSTTDPSVLYTSSSAGGPAYIIAQGNWPSSFVNPADKKSYKFIVVSPQAAQGISTTAPQLEVILTWLVKNYRIDQTRLYLTGLSAGGEGVLEYTGKALFSGQAMIGTHKVAALIPMSAVMNGGLRQQYADTLVADNVQVWGFGSPTDTHGANTLGLIWYINNIKANYALSTSYVGGHCCWEQFYDPNFTQNGLSIYQWALQYTTSGSSAVVTGPTPVTSYTAIPGKVEAESYADMSGVQTETTSDTGGGLDVGWIDAGDYMDYTVAVATAGQYTASFRIASPNAGASFEVLNSAGTVLANVAVTNTGAYQTWQTVTANLTLPAGNQTLRIQSTGAGWNFNWMQFAQAVSTPTPVYTAIPGKIEAESYADMSGVQTETTADAGGGLDVGWIDAGDYMDYNVAVATAGQYTASFRIASPNTGAAFEVLNSAGTVLANVAVTNTGAYQSWQTVTANLTLPAGNQVLRIKSTGAGWNFNWMQFAQYVAASAPASGYVTIPGKIEAESYVANDGTGTETTSDVGGGLDVGWFNSWCWLNYNVYTATAGQYTVGFRVATANTGAALQLVNSAGTVLTTVTIPNTGAYQTWQTVTAVVTLPAGNQTLQLKSAASAVWNINWMQFTQGVTSSQASNSVVIGTQDGSSVTATQNASAATSVATPGTAATLTLFPNPVRGAFLLQLNNSLAGKMQVKVVDVSGSVRQVYEVIKSTGPAQVTINTAGLSSGTYFVQIQLGSWSEVRKIFKL